MSVAACTVLALTAGAIPIVAQTQADLIETWIEYRDRSHRACRKDDARDGPRMAAGNGTERNEPRNQSARKSLSKVKGRNTMLAFLQKDCCRQSCL